MTPAHALLFRCIDYAGLFPPASLDLRTTVENYASFHAGTYSWALGRLILPSDRIVDFAHQWPQFAAEWPIAILLRSNRVESLRFALEAGIPLNFVESGPLPVDAAERLVALLPASAVLYVEVDCRTDPSHSIEALAHAGARAKIRTGGITASAIPSSSEVARFIACCVQRGVPFKATAGLHHALPGIYPLTADPNSGRAPMLGFVNMILASALLAGGGDLVTAIRLLDDHNAGNFHFEQEHIGWRDWNLTAPDLSEIRKQVIVSFGSCSFTEPLAEMREAGWLD